MKPFVAQCTGAEHIKRSAHDFCDCVSYKGFAYTGVSWKEADKTFPFLFDNVIKDAGLIDVRLDGCFCQMFLRRW